MTKGTTLLELKHIKKAFAKKGQQDFLVLNDINFKLDEREIVALIGKSGCGKSTLLRIMAGIMSPTEGEVVYRGQPVKRPIDGMAMVFQEFALLPWLTVLQNVELGLEARRVSRKERRERALKTIDIVGLDGFESAYPKELSGGMQQRVGFARALVVEPELLLMDEPFSALDMLTADNLRSDLLDIWNDKKTNTKSIFFVTHNIEEAALLADRIIVLGNDPAYVREQFDVNLAHPRNGQDPKLRKLVDDIYTLMTTAPTAGGEAAPGGKFRSINMGYRLPNVSVSEMTGFLESLSEASKEKVDLPDLADRLHLDVDDLFPITEALEILRFVNVAKGDIQLMRAGKIFIQADILERKNIFASHLISYVPLVRHIRRVLDERPGNRASEERFLRELEDYLSEEEAESVLEIAIDWGRYAELFAYDYNTGILNLENP